MSAHTKVSHKKARLWAEKQYQRHLRYNKHFAKPGVHRFQIILDSLKPSFNIGKIFRSADAFGAAGIHLVGNDFFDVRPAKGASKYVPAHFHASFSSCHDELKEQDCALFILDPKATLSLHEANLPVDSGFIFGHEEFGFSFDASAYPSITPLCIPQFGRVQSINVSIAASIVMYEYMRQHNTAL